MYYPLFLDLTGKKCLVVGGGQVALRKVKMLLEHSAGVVVVSPEVCPEMAGLVETGQVQLLKREYRQGDLAGAVIAIAATGDVGINLRVSAEARSIGVLVNVVDDAGNSDFIVPSYFRRGDVTIAVSTAGKSPALARRIRTDLERRFGDGYEALAGLVGEVREELRRQGRKFDGDTWQEALELETLLERLNNGDEAGARAALLDHFMA